MTNTDQQKPLNLIELKAKMLCEGVNTSPEIERLFLEQNPSKAKRGGLSSGGKMKIGGSIYVNAPFYRSKKTDLSLWRDVLCDHGFIIKYNNEPIATGEVLKSPNWYNNLISGFSITQILTSHGRQLAGSIYEDCSLFSHGNQCKFCVINSSLANRSPLLIKKKAKLFTDALNLIPINSYDGLTLNGGMTMHEGRGMEIIEPVVREIYSNYKIPIGIEITPPINLDWILRLKDAGVDSLMMNLEVWDEKLRRQYIPGKNELCTKEVYLKAFEYALKIFGPGKVSSCFVIGIESLDSIKAGIQQITDLGVIPSPLAGRYFEDIPDYPFSQQTDFRQFLEILQFTNELMFQKGLITRDVAGCVACGMCDLIKDQTNL